MSVWGSSDKNDFRRPCNVENNDIWTVVGFQDMEKDVSVSIR